LVSKSSYKMEKAQSGYGCKLITVTERQSNFRRRRFGRNGLIQDAITTTANYCGTIHYAITVNDCYSPHRHRFDTTSFLYDQYYFSNDYVITTTTVSHLEI
uniref:ZP domain-containing protein n=1 Tax=Angiostrongylus cantonensis TaxID=6313 RepID=A0A0K0D1E5_ANGCA